MSFIISARKLQSRNANSRVTSAKHVIFCPDTGSASARCLQMGLLLGSLFLPRTEQPSCCLFHPSHASGASFSSHGNTGQTGSPPPNHLVPKLIFKYGYILKYRRAALARPFLACFICLPVGHASSSLLRQSNPQFLQFPVSFPLKNLKSYEKHLNIKLTFISTMCPGLGRRPCPHPFHQQLSVALT